MPITNPYLLDQANAITQTATSNLNNNILPGVRSGAMVAGGYGGSRQGIAEGTAIGQTNQGITNSLASMYGNAYEGDQNRLTQQQMQAAQIAAQQQISSQQNQTTRDLGFGGLANQKLATDNQFTLGMGGLGLNDKAQDQNFYTQNRNLDLSQMGLGAQLAQQGNTGLLNQGQQVYGLGLTQQQAPYNALGQFSSFLQPYTGLNQTQSQNTPNYSALQGALSGSVSLSQLYKLLYPNGG